MYSLHLTHPLMFFDGLFEEYLLSYRIFLYAMPVAKTNVIKQWLGGDSRDKIASDN